MSEVINYENRDSAQERRKIALKKISEMSQEKIVQITEEAKKISNEEAKKNLKTDEWLVMDCICNAASKVELDKMDDSEIEILRKEIRSKFISDNLTFYESAILKHLCLEWGPFDLHDNHEGHEEL